jgi:hypothetical protein
MVRVTASKASFARRAVGRDAVYGETHDGTVARTRSALGPMGGGVRGHVGKRGAGLRIEALKRTTTSESAALDGYVHDHLLTRFEPTVAPWMGDAQHVAPNAGVGLEAREAVAVETRDAGPSAVLFLSTCPGGGCGECAPPDYRFTKENDGAIVILRPVARVHTRAVHQRGSCRFGCGQSSAPNTKRWYLPVLDASRVRVESVGFDAYEVEPTCDRRIPAP